MRYQLRWERVPSCRIYLYRPIYIRVEAQAEVDRDRGAEAHTGIASEHGTGSRRGKDVGIACGSSRVTMDAVGFRPASATAHEWGAVRSLAG
jgi:hypothetical protein